MTDLCVCRWVRWVGIYEVENSKKAALPAMPAIRTLPNAVWIPHFGC